MGLILHTYLELNSLILHLSLLSFVYPLCLPQHIALYPVLPDCTVVQRVHIISCVVIDSQLFFVVSMTLVASSVDFDLVLYGCAMTTRNRVCLINVHK